MKSLLILFIFTLITSLRAMQPADQPAKVINVRVLAEEFKKNYPHLFSELLPRYEFPLLIYLRKVDPILLKKINESGGQTSALVWKALNEILGLDVPNIKDHGAGYIFFYPREATGKPIYYDIDQIPALYARKFADPLARERLAYIAGSYKFHLMPHRQFIPEMIIKLIKALKLDPDLGPLIRTFKVKYKKATIETIPLKVQKQQHRMPRIVIYGSHGKENAQKLLDKLIKLFKNDVEKGIGIGPRWNQKVNNLIYFAQGDGDTKKLPEYAVYFQQPQIIYYQPLFSGIYQDYYLKF